MFTFAPGAGEVMRHLDYALPQQSCFTAAGINGSGLAQASTPGARFIQAHHHAIHF
jgi:hypothetical protein